MSLRFPRGVFGAITRMRWLLLMPRRQSWKDPPFCDAVGSRSGRVEAVTEQEPKATEVRGSAGQSSRAWRPRFPGNAEQVTRFNTSLWTVDSSTEWLDAIGGGKQSI